MRLFASRAEFERIMTALFERVLADQEIVRGLSAADLVVRFRYRDPEAVVTINLKSSPPFFRFDDRGAADVEMIQSAETSHEFWLGRLSPVRGIATGRIRARGNVVKALKLLPAIKPAFALYPQVLKDLGQAHLVPRDQPAIRRRGWWSRWRPRLAPRVQGFDRRRLPPATRPGLAREPEAPPALRTQELPAGDRALRIEILRRMNLIRAFEESLAREWAAGNVPTEAIHLSVGQEAMAVGVCFALAPGDAVATTHRGHGHMIARGAPLSRMMAEIYGRAGGLCGGKGGGMHVLDASLGALGANGIVGAGPLLAVGAGLAFHLDRSSRVAVCFLGDGATNQGMFHEAMNLAALWRLPVLFVVENNQYGEFTPQRRHMAIERIADRAAAYGMPGERVDGNDADEVLATTRRLLGRIRSGQGPALLEGLTYRWRGHMEGDAQAYRPAEEVEAWKRRCPINRLAYRLAERGDLSAQGELDLVNQAEAEAARAVEFALGSPEPGPETLARHVFADEPPPPENPPPGRMRAMTGSAAINLALAEEMRRDPKVILLGEDVSLGGYMAVTTGLIEEFGPERVRDTPISENAIVGGAVGAAMCGYRPVAEILFSDFVTCAMDPIVNQAAKLRYMSGGQYKAPLVVRLPGGAGLAMAAQHSQSLEAMFLGVPGLIVAAPGRPRDARALLKTAIRSENPVLFFEHKLCYLMEGEVPENEELLPFGRAAVVREGGDATVVALLYTVHLALEAAEILAAEDIRIEVIDLRTLSPLDMETV
ncbi:MAG: thiamine pyrophosphate-dependent enzyme, partial [Thermodesulfobacteriota bacterium]